MPGAENESTQEVSQPGAVGTETPVSDKETGSEANGFKSVDEAMEEIKKLRAENAKHRTKNKELDSKISGMDVTLAKLKTALGGEGSELSPEDQVKALQAEKEALQVELGMGQLIRGHQIQPDQEKYFRFLLAEKFEALKDGEELDEEQVATIATEAKKLGAKPNGGSTGVKPGAAPNPTASAAVTPEAFSKMSITERSILYTKNPALYQQLFAECSTKKLI